MRFGSRMAGQDDNVGEVEAGWWDGTCQAAAGLDLPFRNSREARQDSERWWAPS